MDKMINEFRYYTEPPSGFDNWGLSVHGIGGYSGLKGEVKRSGRIFPHFALVYITDGGGTWLKERNGTGDKAEELVPGDCLLIIPGVWHSYFPHENKGWSQYWVLFNGFYAHELVARGVFDKTAAHFHAGLDYSIIDHYKSIKSTIETNPIPPHRHLASRLYSLINLVWDLKENPVERSPVRKEISIAESYIREEWDSELDYKALADRLNMSYSSFRRLFKRKTGYSPHSFQLSLRINKAKHLMDTTDLTVKQIGLQTGFQDPCYFSRIFKEKTGIAPSRWHTF